MLGVASRYPTAYDPVGGAFIQVLMRDLFALGVKPTVLAPEKVFSLGRRRGGFSRPPRQETRDGVEVLRPRYVSFSNRWLPLGISTYRWTVAGFRRAVLRTASRAKERPQLCYGHFLYPAGLSARMVGQRLGVPSVVGLGEGSFVHYDEHFGLDQVRANLSGFSGILTVSDGIRERCIEQYGVDDERIRVFPNASASYFFPRSREEMRRKLGLPLDRPIVAFVGHFDENKGADRVLEAIRSRPEIGAFFLGMGQRKPTGIQVLFSGLVPHEEVPEWLSAADIFVQPVKSEASSNSMKEALACGLPVVSSKIPSNLEFLDGSVATLVDPNDVRQIRTAIEELVDQPDRRAAMGAAALERSKHFRSPDRARKILEWLSEVAAKECAS